MKVNKSIQLPLHLTKNKMKSKETAPAIVETSTPTPTPNELPAFDGVVLWVQDKNGNPSRPALKGYVNKADGTRMEIVLWDSLSERGNAYFKGRIMPERKNIQQEPINKKDNEESAPY